MTFAIRIEEQEDGTWAVVLYSNHQVTTVWPAYPSKLLAKVGACRMREQKGLPSDTSITVVPLSEVRQ